MRLGKVVKSNSHCDYVVQLDDRMDVAIPPQADDYGFGSFVRLDDPETGRHWAIGIIYNSQIVNPALLNPGPRLSSEPDPLFTPDLIQETRTLLWTVLVGVLVSKGKSNYGIQGIPPVVVPVNAIASTVSPPDLHHFHLTPDQEPQFRYYGHLLRYGGTFASQLTQKVLQDLIDTQRFSPAGQRALEMLCRELSWKNTVSAM